MVPRPKGGCGHCSPSGGSVGCFFGPLAQLASLPQTLTIKLLSPPPQITMLSRTSQRAAQVKDTLCNSNWGSRYKDCTLKPHIQTLLRGAKPARCGPSMATRSTHPHACRISVQWLTSHSNGHGRSGHLQAHQVRRQIHRHLDPWYAAITAYGCNTILNDAQVTASVPRYLSQSRRSSRQTMFP
jgi:hypothetical protein